MNFYWCLGLMTITFITILIFVYFKRKDRFKIVSITPNWGGVGYSDSFRPSVPACSEKDKTKEKISCFSCR